MGGQPVVLSGSPIEGCLQGAAGRGNCFTGQHAQAAFGNQFIRHSRMPLTGAHRANADGGNVLPGGVKRVLKSLAAFFFEGVDGLQEQHELFDSGNAFGLHGGMR